MSATRDPDTAARLARVAARREAREGRAGAPATPFAGRWGRALVAAVAMLAALTVAGLVLLWPGTVARTGPSQAMGGRTLGATVLADATVPCAGPTRQACRRLTVRVDD